MSKPIITTLKIDQQVHQKLLRILDLERPAREKLTMRDLYTEALLLLVDHYIAKYGREVVELDLVELAQILREQKTD